MFCITIDGKTGALILMHDNIAYYYYAGATKEGVKQNRLFGRLAMYTKPKRKCKLWDFEGIYDERYPNKDWLGFSHFQNLWWN